MFETGISSNWDIAEDAPGQLRASAMRPHNRPGLKKQVISGIAACTFMFAFIAPISVDFASGEIAFNVALAGNGDGNFGEGKGNGGANNQNPGNKGNKGDDEGDKDDEGNVGNGNPPTLPVTGDRSQESGADAASGMADADFNEAIDAVAGSPAEGPMAGTPATSLPTISQLFSMGDEAAVSTEDELELIANGWGATN